MPFFRKKPVVIEARQFTDENSGLEIAAWCFGEYSYEDADISLQTLEGTMTASRGDWVVMGWSGEFYPVKPDIFKATYELVEENINA